MGHMDGRLTEETVPTPKPEAGVKDGVASTTSNKAPSKDDPVQTSLEKASDVVHDGDASTTGKRP